MSQKAPKSNDQASAAATALAASIDAAAEDLDRNGPALPEEVRQALLGLGAEWGEGGSPTVEPYRKAARSAR